MEEKIMLSVTETSRKTGINKVALRELCKREKIPYLKSGKKFLINYEVFKEMLRNGELKDVSISSKED